MNASDNCQRPEDQAVSNTLAALAHPARIAILRHLSCSGSCCCKDVVAQLNLAQSTVSQHLKVLVEAGLVKFAPEKQRSKYSANQEALRSVAGSLTGLVESCCSGACPPEQNTQQG